VIVRIMIELVFCHDYCKFTMLACVLKCASSYDCSANSKTGVWMIDYMEQLSYVETY
jgi:hypothetical protein